MARFERDQQSRLFDFEEQTDAIYYPAEWKSLHYLRRLSSGLALKWLGDPARYQLRPGSTLGSSIGALQEFRLKDWCVRWALCCSTWELRLPLQELQAARAARRYVADSATIFEETRKALLCGFRSVAFCRRAWALSSGG